MQLTGLIMKCAVVCKEDNRGILLQLVSKWQHLVLSAWSWDKSVLADCTRSVATFSASAVRTAVRLFAEAATELTCPTSVA